MYSETPLKNKISKAQKLEFGGVQLEKRQRNSELLLKITQNIWRFYETETYGSKVCWDWSHTWHELLRNHMFQDIYTFGYGLLLGFVDIIMWNNFDFFLLW